MRRIATGGGGQARVEPSWVRLPRWPRSCSRPAAARSSTCPTHCAAYSGRVDLAPLDVVVTLDTSSSTDQETSDGQRKIDVPRAALADCATSTRPPSARAHPPGHEAIVLLATDGFLTACDAVTPPRAPRPIEGIPAVAAAAAGAEASVPTFVLGAFAAIEVQTARQQLSFVARAGGSAGAQVLETDGDLTGRFLSFAPRLAPGSRRAPPSWSTVAATQSRRRERVDTRCAARATWRRSVAACAPAVTSPPAAPVVRRLRQHEVRTSRGQRRDRTHHRDGFPPLPLLCLANTRAPGPRAEILDRARVHREPPLMPSWAEIQEYARSKYILQHDEENWFSLIFEYDSGRTHRINVRKYAAFDEEWIEFLAMVCKGNEMPPKVALRKNHDLVIGALALDKDDDYVLVHNAPLATLDLPEFERPLHVIARTADSLEKDYSEGHDDF